MRWIVATIAAAVAGSAAVLSADAAELSTLVSGRFVAVPASELPHGGATYDDATCPSESRCYVVGTGLGGGVLTTTADGGASWSSSALPDAVGLKNFAIACPSASVCYVGGTAGTSVAGRTLMLATRDSGHTWSIGTIPAGSLVTSISCVSTTSCIAVGSNSPATPQSTVLTTSDSGATWAGHPSPANNFDTVRCVDATHCWAAGPGAWFTPDLGATWQDESPPSSHDCPTTNGFGICSAYYSQTIDIEFQSDADGWVVGGDQCGGVGATQCAGAAFHSTDGGATWTVSKGSLAYPFNWQIACQGSVCILVGQAFTHSVIAVTTNAGSNWSGTQQVATALNALACTPSRSFCIVAGGINNVPALFTLGAATAAPASATAVTSTLGTSLATPASLTAAPLNTLVNALITVALIMLITFPSQLFNRTYDENHERIRDWLERRVPWLGRARAGGMRTAASTRTLLSVGAVLVAGGVLAALLDPRFGFNLRSLALFAGAVLAITAGISVTGVAAGVYRRARHKESAWHLRALPSALVVGGVCVLISRLTAFQPGYLYGLIAGVAFSGRLSQREEGHEVAVSTLCTLAVSVIAWLVWVPVAGAAAARPANFGLAVVENFLAAMFISGMVGLVIGLVPLRFLPGERLVAWHAGVWAVVFGVVLLTTIEVILQPQTHAHGGSVAPLWTTLGLFIGFGIASLAFWGYFKVHTAAAAEPA